MFYFYRATFPNRKVYTGRPSCICHMVACGCGTTPSDESMIVEATDERAAWDRVHRQFPLETVIITKIEDPNGR